ncbi:MAG: PDR/VanB family oxidoreductase [Aeromicrobium sp.]
MLEVDDSIPAIRSLVLGREDGAVLPSFTPGSHLVIECGPRSNAYSLTGESIAPTTYRISVLRLADGMGGSRWIHDELVVGSHVAASAPRSAFAPAAVASRHLMIAGGVGVTPIVSHLRAARRWQRQVQVLYTYRAGFGAHVEDLEALAGDGLELFTDPATFTARLDTVLAEQPIGTHLYICGPAGLMEHVCQRAEAMGWPPSRLHLERFSAGALDPGTPFEVNLTASKRTLTVPSGTTLLSALQERGIEVPNMCRQGVCGECRIPVSAGAVDHRDLYLSAREKETNTTMMCCVSRAAGQKLEIPL